MGTIKQLPELERPREKAIRFGIETLSNEELLALLIGSGTKDASALDVAHRLNSDSHGLTNLFSQSYRALIETKGIGQGKALILSACFELSRRYQYTIIGEKRILTSEDLYNRYKQKLNNKEKESLALIVLNRHKEIIYEEIMYVGNENKTMCRPLEIVRKVLLHDGKSFYVIHNHPSGILLASEDDKYITSEISRAAKRVKISLIDHLIITCKGYISIKEKYPEFIYV